MNEDMDDYDSLPTEEDVTSEHLPLIDLEKASSHPSSRRKRLIQIGLVLAAGVVILITFWNLVPSGSKIISSNPTPSTPYLLITSNLTYGTVAINGVQQHGTLPLLVVAPSHPFVVTVDAPPFALKRCQIPSSDAQTPDAFATSCQFSQGNSGPVTLHGVTRDPFYRLDIRFTTDDLPPNQQDQVATLVKQQISTKHQMNVPGATYIAVGLTSDQRVRSRQYDTPLQATAMLLPSTSPDNPSCRRFICPAVLSPASLTSLPAHAWAITVLLMLRWQFNTMSGKEISNVLFPSPGGSTLLLTYMASTGWHFLENLPLDEQATDSFSALVCATGNQMLSSAVQGSLTANPSFAHQTEEGCEITLQGQAGTSLGIFLWRFGVVLAVDAQAHRQVPSLPIAPPDEVTAAEG